jgi:hypothetical protein
MGWERRGNGYYYYRKRRRGRRCSSQYVGAGVLASLFAAQYDAEREQRRAERRVEQQQRQEYEAVVQTATDACRMIDTLNRAVLLTSVKSRTIMYQAASARLYHS